MSEFVTLREAKAQLSRLIKRASDGEEIIIRRGQRALAKLVGYDKQPVPRQMGALRGEIWVSDDFDEPDEKLERLFGTRG